jgi:SAM-dependent methyltransferase
MQHSLRVAVPIALRSRGRGGAVGPACVALALTFAPALVAAERSFTPYTSAKPILEAQRKPLPAELRNTGEAGWLAWSRREDKAIRARLELGDLDSMVNLLLYGTSFTRQPRILMEGLTQASKDGILRARVDDLVAGLGSPGNNERLVFLGKLLRNEGIDPADPKEAGTFVYNNLLRVIKERKSLAERAADAEAREPREDPASLLDRASLFRDRGLSLDTGIIPDFTIEQTLHDLKERGVVREGGVARVAVIGPGLDFIDKNEDSAFDYYPPQIVQPFALYDSLVRLRLAKANGLSLSVFDISSRVIEHIQRARERARKSIGYEIQLPRDIARPWPADLSAHWRSLGDQVGTVLAPIEPPGIFPGLETRAVRIRPEVVLACEPVDLDIVLERLDLAAAERFDLIIATNIFVYYDGFEQALALENAGAMLKAGGLLLTNDRLPEVPGDSMRLEGITVVPFDSPGVNARQAVGWYRKR